MWLMPRHFFLLVPLFFVTTVQAASDELPAHGEGSVVFTPAARPHFSNLDPQPGRSFDGENTQRSGSRYGIGYDARHGIDTDAGNQRSNRMSSGERPQPPARGERSGGAGRGGRGR